MSSANTVIVSTLSKDHTALREDGLCLLRRCPKRSWQSVGKGVQVTGVAVRV